MSNDHDPVERSERRRREYEAELHELTNRLERLKKNYDRYFLGLERIPPQSDRDRLDRDFRLSVLHKVNKTALKFRFRNLQHRYSTYASHWDRTMRAIEEGTFRRDRGGGPEIAPPPPPPEEPGQRAGRDVERLYEEWSRAREEVGASAGPAVGFERFKARFEKMREQHRQKLGSSDVDYSVRVKDGKVKLVARKPREE